jgi:hypothetical protein
MTTLLADKLLADKLLADKPSDKNRDVKVVDCFTEDNSKTATDFDCSSSVIG